MRTIKPNVNPHGDSREALLDQMTEARQALLDAAKLMVEAAPNGRNYLWLGGNSGQRLTDDIAEANRRIGLVQDLAEAYYQDAIALVDDD